MHLALHLLPATPCPSPGGTGLGGGSGGKRRKATLTQVTCDHVMGRGEGEGKRGGEAGRNLWNGHSQLGLQICCGKGGGGGGSSGEGEKNFPRKATFVILGKSAVTGYKDHEASER